jgi:hypothetical protein
MKRLLRTLVAARGLIIAGTLALATLGGYLDRGTAPSAMEVDSPLAAHVQALDGHYLSVYDACAQPGYGKMILCPLWH